MAIELDHFFILTDPGAPQADLLLDIGLNEGTRNHHPGQGTANRRFFFPNTALELIYVSDETEAATGRGRQLHFAQRAKNIEASPFGLIVREKDDSADLPFPGWRYCPEYFLEDQCFHVGKNSDLFAEPLCIRMPLNPPLSEPQPAPGNPDMLVTEIRICVPVPEPSPTLQKIAECDRISLRVNEPHRMELIFNDREKGKSKDMNPELPLVVYW